MLRAIPLVMLAFVSAPLAWAQQKSVEELTKTALESVVVISHEGRTEGTGATGTGFIIDPSGLIATNWHVINDRRRIEVELHDGTKLTASAVHAWDRRLDLALIKIEPKPGQILPALELGNSDELEQGQSVIALGNPRGLKFSVVEGVVGAMRSDINSESPFPLIQVSMPVEEGNSGGPLLDRQGRVHGVISLKSMMTPNLGFAMPSNALKILLEKPNPIAMNHWATIGTLDPRQWSPIMGATWTQHAGRIQAKGLGSGFGGRTLCIANRPVPDKAYEVEVEVKLDDEKGAAGLAFACDGGDVHYGFYPTNGVLRLTRFEGPDISSWQILKDSEVEAYKLSEWNRIKVRVEPDHITCFVNDMEVVRHVDDQLRGGKVGLCKFRQTEAEFRNFRVGEQLKNAVVDAKMQAEFNQQIESYLSTDGAPREDLLATLTKQPLTARASLDQVNAALKLKVEELRRLTRDANSEFIGAQMSQLLAQEEDQIDLFHAGLLIAKLDNPDLEVEGYRLMLDQMGMEILARLKAADPEEIRVEAVRKFMFEESGFHGSRLEYYSESNSYLNSVLDDREGIPISLSVVFLELARRAGCTTIHGVGMPGHFMVGYQNEKGLPMYLDAFEGTEPVGLNEAKQFAMGLTGAMVKDEHLAPVAKRDILVRMLRNLIGIKKGPGPGADRAQFSSTSEPVAALPYLNVTLAIAPEDATARFDRAILRFQEGDREGAKVDLRWLLQNEPPGLNLPRLREFYEQL